MFYYTSNPSAVLNELKMWHPMAITIVLCSRWIRTVLAVMVHNLRNNSLENHTILFVVLNWVLNERSFDKEHLTFNVFKVPQAFRMNWATHWEKKKSSPRFRIAIQFFKKWCILEVMHLLHKLQQYLLLKDEPQTVFVLFYYLLLAVPIPIVIHLHYNNMTDLVHLHVLSTAETKASKILISKLTFLLHQRWTQPESLWLHLGSTQSLADAAEMIIICSKEYVCHNYHVLWIVVN